MKSTTKETFLSAFRHALTMAGGVAATHGYGSKEEITMAIGAIVALVGAFWGPLDEYLAARQSEQDLRLKLAVDAAVAAALAQRNQTANPTV